MAGMLLILRRGKSTPDKLLSGRLLGARCGGLRHYQRRPDRASAEGKQGGRGKDRGRERYKKSPEERHFRFFTFRFRQM